MEVTYKKGDVEYKFKLKDNNLAVKNAEVRFARKLSMFLDKEMRDVEKTLFKKHEDEIATVNKQIAHFQKEMKDGKDVKASLETLQAKLAAFQEAYWLDSKAQAQKAHHEQIYALVIAEFFFDKDNLMQALGVYMDGDFSVLDFNDVEGIGALRQEAEKAFFLLMQNTKAN